LYKDLSVAGEIGLERDDERFRPGLFNNLPTLGICARELEPPLGPAANKRAIEDQTREIAPPQRTGRDQRDD
jgi:hypothetical protein